MALISVCDDAGNVIETHQHAGEFIRTESPRFARDLPRVPGFYGDYIGG
jgi:hypothetical protein